MRAGLVYKMSDVELKQIAVNNRLFLNTCTCNGTTEGSNISSLAVNLSTDKPSRLHWIKSVLTGCIGEFLGTFLLTVIICTVVTTAVITGAQQGIWQVAIPGALGVAISIYLSAHISEAHLNPAITLAVAVIRWKQFHWSKVIPYIIAQVFGGFCAGIMLFVFYHDAISNFETERNITRGENGSELTAMLFGEYFPNPALYDPPQLNESIISLPEALLVEAWATAILVFVFFSITHPDNTTINNNKGIIPIIVGLTVACLVSIYGPLTQAGLNPARDFGPRLFAAMAGWGKIAIPGPRFGFWAYIIGPLVGGLAGGALNDLVMFCVRRCSGKKKTNDIN